MARNRKRPRAGGRQICCPVHGCRIESVSQKHPLFAETREQLREHGVSGRQAALLLRGGVAPLQNVWLEAFWCSECQQSRWYRVHKLEGEYHVIEAQVELWKRSIGTIDPNCSNPSVGEFTRREARGKQCDRM
jgi:hypothetical protein